MKCDQLILSRQGLVEAYQIACVVTDDDTKPDELRGAAARVEFRLSEALLHQSHGADGERSIRLIPVGFGWPQFYTQMVDEFILDLGEDVAAEEPAWVLLAKHWAALTDNALYSSDFRLDCFDVLNEILARLKQAAEDEDELVEP
jgi:hypothetical protein